MQLHITAIHNTIHTVVKAMAKVMIKEIHVCLKHSVIIMDTRLY